MPDQPTLIRSMLPAKPAGPPVPLPQGPPSTFAQVMAAMAGATGLPWDLLGQPGGSPPVETPRGYRLGELLAMAGPLMAAGKKIPLTAMTPKENPLVLTDELRAHALRDRLAAGLVNADLQSDAAGVVVGQPRRIDAALARGDYSEAEVHGAFANTREAIRKAHGDTVTLYRADAPTTEHSPHTRTVLMGDKATAEQFAERGRTVTPFTVPVDDILAVYSHGRGVPYTEFIVRKPK